MGLFRKNILEQIHVGAIVRMGLASRSHVSSFYFVEILEVNDDKIVTNIPGKHSLVISKDNNWDYHIPRMKYIGHKAQYGYLIMNQKLI